MLYTYSLTNGKIVSACKVQQDFNNYDLWFANRQDKVLICSYDEVEGANISSYYESWQLASSVSNQKNYIER